MATSTIKVNDKYVGNFFVESIKTTFTNTTIPSGKTANITISGGLRSVMSIMSNDSDGNGQYHVNSASAGTITRVTVKDASSVSINTSTNNRVVITNNASAKLYVSFMIIDGSVTGVEIT